MPNLDKPGRNAPPVRPDSCPAEPAPAAVASLEDLCRELDRLRRRHAHLTGAPRPVGLGRLARLCAVPRSTLHTYLTGAVVPAGSALDAIVLALGASMTEAAAWGAALERVAESHHASGVHSADASSRAMRQVMAELTNRLDRPSDRPASSLQRLALFERVQLGDDRDIATIGMRVTARATVPGVDRYLLTCAPSPEIDLDAFGLSGHLGCRDGSHRTFRDLGLRVFELLLDRPLELGEVTMMSFTLERARARRGAGTPTQQALRHFPQRGPTFALEVAFRPGDPPVAARQVHVLDAAAPDSSRQMLRLGQDLTAQMAVERPAFGLHGIRWDWPD